MALASCVNCANPNQASSTSQKENQPQNFDKDLPIAGDGSLFLSGVDCGPDEYLAQGKEPTCEPTCSNPRPHCPKIYFSGIDYVPCFCKVPLVRDTKTKRCIPLSECPRQ